MDNRAWSTNSLVNSKYYGEILQEYNARLASDGKVNNLAFWRDFILPRMPTYGMQSWYQFLRKFKTANGIAEARIVAQDQPIVSSGRKEELNLKENLMNMSEATRIGLIRSLNIGSDAMKEILDNPHMLAPKDKIELLFKAMKAQDSRARVMTELRKDNREQMAFEEIMDKSAYEMDE